MHSEFDSEFDNEHSKHVGEISAQVAYSPSAFRLWLVPLFFSIAIGLCGFILATGNATVGGVSMVQVNLNLLFAGVASFFVASVVYDRRIRQIATRVFWQNKEADAPKITIPEDDKSLADSLNRWMGYDWQWLDTGVGANVPRGMGRFILLWISNFFYFMAFVVFIGISPKLTAQAYLWQDLLRSLLLVAVTYFKATSQIRSMNNLRQTYLRVAQNANLHYLLKP